MTYVAACSREITKMKQASEGTLGVSEEFKEGAFQVVPVESTSEYMTQQKRAQA